MLFWSFGTYLAFFDLGMGPTLSREIAFLSVQPQDTRLQTVADLVATCVRIYLLVAGSLLIVAILGGLLFLPTLRLTTLSHTDILFSWILFVTGSCINLIGNIPYAMLTGEGHVAKERLTRAASMLLWLALSAYTLTSGRGLLGLSTAWLIYSILSRFMAVAGAKHFLPELTLLRGRWRKDHARSIAMPSARWALTQLGALLILQTDNVIIAWTLGPKAIPAYEAAAKVITAMGTIALLRTNATVPYYSRLWSYADLTGMGQLLYANVDRGLLIMCTAFSFMSFFGRDVFQLWLGPGHFVGYPILLVLLVTASLETHQIGHATLTMATGNIPFVRIALGAGVLNLLLSLLLVRTEGLLGVALGTLLAQIATNYWYGPYVTLRLIKVSPLRYIKRFTIKVIPTLILFVGLQAVASKMCQGRSSSLRLVIGVSLSFLIYGIATYARWPSSRMRNVNLA